MQMAKHSRGEDKTETEIVTSARNKEKKKKREKSGKNKSQKRPNERGSKYAIMLFIFSYKNAKQGKETESKNHLVSYHGNVQKLVYPTLHKRETQNTLNAETLMPS